MLTKEMTINDYEAIKCETLLQYGCPKDELWLTECTSIKSFKQFYGNDTAEDLFGDKDYKGCVYYHESGDLHVTGGFSNMEEFESSCKYVAEYLSN
jgi:hypothetical protein